MFQIGVSVKNQNKMTDSVDPDETARNEPSDLDLHYLYRYLFWSVGMNGLRLELSGPVSFFFFFFFFLKL